MSLKRIDELFNFEKGVLQSSKSTPGSYNFITASAEWKTHKVYTHDCEALIFAAAASGSLGRTHYVNGKFISSDLCFIITPKDPKNFPIDLKFYHLLFNSLRNEIVRNTKAGTSKEAIGLTSFGKYQIPYFSIEKQKTTKSKFLNVQHANLTLYEEFDRQQKLLSQLRQSFLREAMQGKLVKQDPNDGQAKDLLEKIKAEKAKLGKKEKELPPINQEEIPFEIPENWVWCRLGEIISFISGNNFNSTDFKKGEGVKCIKITNAGVGEIVETDDVLPLSFLKKYKSFLVFEHDLVLALTRPYISEGLKISKCSNSYHMSLLNQRVAVIRMKKNIEVDYVYQYLRSNYVLQIYKAKFDGKGQQPNLKKEDVIELLIPLPPLSEQTRIVNKLHELMNHFNGLQQSIQKCQEQNELLLQQVLKESLTSK